MKYNQGAILRSVEQPFLKDDIPDFDSGDTIRVNYSVVEGNRRRIQAFEGVVIARKNGKKGARATITVRKVSFGEGVERVFPLHSPLIDSIVVVRRGRTRRAKLYYLRDLRGKAARLRTDLSRQEEDRAAARSSKARRAEEAAAMQAQQESETAQEAARAAEAQAQNEITEAEAAPAESTSETETQPQEPTQAEVTESEAAVAAEPDDLTKIEGIGPKYAEALIAAGLTSYADLAKADQATFEKAAEAADMKPAASMESWSKQAQYLVDGDEAGLKAYQDELDGGREA